MDSLEVFDIARQHDQEIVVAADIRKVRITDAGSRSKYVAGRHSVVVETNAGAGIGATDDSYRKAPVRLPPHAYS